MTYELVTRQKKVTIFKSIIIRVYHLTRSFFTQPVFQDFEVSFLQLVLQNGNGIVVRFRRRLEGNVHLEPSVRQWELVGLWNRHFHVLQGPGQDKDLH